MTQVIDRGPDFFANEAIKQKEFEIYECEGYTCIEASNGFLYRVDEEGCVDIFINNEWVEWALSNTGLYPTEVMFIVNGKECSCDDEF